RPAVVDRDLRLCGTGAVEDVGGDLREFRGVVGDQAMAARHQLQRELAFAGPGLAGDQHADGIDLHEHPVQRDPGRQRTGQVVLQHVVELVAAALRRPQRDARLFGHLHQVLRAGLALVDHQRQRPELQDLLQCFPALPGLQAVEPGQFLAAEDLHLVGIDDVEVTGQRRPARHGVDRLELARGAGAAGEPFQFKSFAELVEQRLRGDHRLHADRAAGEPPERRSSARSALMSGACGAVCRKWAAARRPAGSVRVWGWCGVRSLGPAMAKTRRTGSPSRALNSIGFASGRTAASGSLQESLRQWGMATPWPIAVLPTASRWRRPLAISPVHSGELPPSRRAATSRTWSRLPGDTTCTMRLAESRSVYGIPGPSVPQPNSPSRTGLPPRRWWSIIFFFSFTSLRSSLSASRSMAAYMSAARASAWSVLPATLTVASARWSGLSMLSWVRTCSGGSYSRDRRPSLVST